MLCLTALGTAACTPFEIGMMHAATGTEYGAWLRGYHVPIFLTIVGTLLFVRFYLGTGRSWLMWTIIALRALVLAVNLTVEPNFNFIEIIALDRFPFLGEQAAVVGSAVPRSWQWVAAASMLLMMVFLIDAAIQRWRKGGAESRRKALLVSLAITAPFFFNALSNQLVVAGILHLPVSSTLWFLGTVVIMSFEFGREFLLGRRGRGQMAELRGELAQLERVNLLGQLASGLAHELAQPLSAVCVNAEVAAHRLRNPNPDLQELRQTVADIEEDTTRAVNTVNHMRTLFKRGRVDTQPLALDGVVRDVLGLLKSEADSRRVVVESNLEPELPRVLADRVHISQVLLNLLVNAMDAVQTRPEGRRHIVVEAHVAAQGGLETVVKDSGPGIPEDKLETIFAPLFTTKPGGLGMGLALCRSIIDAHGGRLWAKNGGTENGATFCFTLPLA